MRWLIRIFGAVIVAAGLGAGALFFMPADRIAGLASAEVARATGRNVEIRGEVRPTLWPHIGVRAEGIYIGNPDWVDAGPMIAADALAVRVPWHGVFSGQISVEEITLIAPDITLVRGADGRVSWDVASAGTGAQPATIETTSLDTPAQPLIGLDGLVITDGSLLYEDRSTDTRYQIAGLDARLSMPRDRAASLTGSATVNGVALDLASTFGDPAALLQGALTGATLALSWPGGTAGFEGDLSTAPSLQGALSLSAEDLSPLLRLAGATMPDLPSGLGRDSIGFEADVSLANAGTAHLRNARLRLDDNTLTLALDITPGDARPTIRGAVRADQLRLPTVETAASDASAGGAPAGAGWSRAPIDVAALFAANAEVDAVIGTLVLRDRTLTPVDLRATLTDGRLVLDIDRIAAYRGALSGQVVVNGRGGLSTRGDLQLAGVDLRPVLTDFAGFDRMSGTADAALEFLAVGNDMATLIESLSGEGRVSLGAGAIDGLDIVGMIRNFDRDFRGPGARTVYNGLAASFTVAGGVLSNSDLRLDADWGDVTGAGTVNLGGQSVDYRLIPGVLRDGAGDGAVRVPVLIRGPWTDLTIRPDLEYLAQQTFEEQRVRLEAEARARLEAETDRLEARVRDEANAVLGLDLQAGDTAADAREALEQRLAEEAQIQLRRLLGGN